MLYKTIYSHSDPCLFLYSGFKNDNCPISFSPSWLCDHVSKCKLTQGFWRYFCTRFGFQVTWPICRLSIELTALTTAGESFYVQTHTRIGVLIQSQLQIENGQLTTDYAKKFQHLDRDLFGSSNQNFSRRNETGFSACRWFRKFL